MNELNQQLHIELKATVLFDYGSVEKLATFIAEECRPLLEEGRSAALTPPLMEARTTFPLIVIVGGTPDEVGVAVGVVLVEVAVAVGVTVLEAVAVAVTVAVAVAVLVFVGVAVGVAPVEVAVAVGVAVLLAVAVAVAVGVAVAVAVAVGVAVGVGVGAMPYAVPLSFTVCGLFAASSTIVRSPDSLVRFGLLALVGSNVTETAQDVFDASVEPHVFALIAKGPLGVIESIASATLFGFDSVTVLGDETVSTLVLGNDREPGLMRILSCAASAGGAAIAQRNNVRATARLPMYINASLQA